MRYVVVEFIKCVAKGMNILRLFDYVALIRPNKAYMTYQLGMIYSCAYSARAKFRYTGVPATRYTIHRAYDCIPVEEMCE